MDAAQLKLLLPLLNTKAANEAVKAIEKLAGSVKDKWQKTILTMIADSIEKHGPSGLALAEGAVFDLMKGKPVKLDFTDLATASDALALLQNAEADKKHKVKDFLKLVGESLGVILASVIKGAVLK